MIALIKKLTGRERDRIWLHEIYRQTKDFGKKKDGDRGVPSETQRGNRRCKMKEK